MGNPKHMWTAEEEAALINGIAKHGAGKWTKIIKDPEFQNVLILRSNIDLKDKWRNMNSATNGEYRHKHKGIKKVVQPTNTSEDSEGSKDPVTGDVKSVAVACEVLPEGSSEKPMSRPVEVDIHSSEKHNEGCEDSAIVQGKLPAASCEALPGGSSEIPMSSLNDYKSKFFTESKGASSSMQTKEQDLAPPSYESLPQECSKLTVDFGKIKKHGIEDSLVQHRIDNLEADADPELMRMRSMTPQEAAAYAEEYVRRAEIAVREAEMAEEEATEAERAAKEAWDYYLEVRRAVDEKKSNAAPQPAPKRRKRGGMR